MEHAIPRKNAIDTFTEAAGWLRDNPILIAAFLVLGAVNALGEISFFVTIVGFVLGLYLAGIAFVFARDVSAGDEPSFGEASSEVVPRLLSLIAIYILYFIAVFVGFILLIIPGIYIGLRLALALPACVLDDQGVFESLSTSWDVAHGNLLKIFGIVLITIAIFIGIGFLIGFLSFVVGFSTALLITIAVATAIVTPILQMSYARIYLENRSSEAQFDDDDEWSDDRASPESDGEWGTAN